MKTRAHNHRCKSKNDERMEKIIETCSEEVRIEKQIEREKDRARERWQKYWKNLSPEKKEDRRKRKREHYYKVIKIRGYYKTGEQKERLRERRKARTTEQREHLREYNRKYWKKLTLEKKKAIGQKLLEYQKKQWTEERKEQNRERHREYYRKLNPEKKAEILQRQREYRKRRRIEAENIKNKGEKILDYCKDVIPKNNEQNLEYCKGNLKTYVGLERNVLIEESNRDMKQEFCYICRIKFLNSNDLLKHIVMHVTQPWVIISRMDEHKRAQHTIQMESENTQINFNLHSISQNIVWIKTETIKYEENIEHELSNVDIKMEIEVDDKSFN